MKIRAFIVGERVQLSAKGQGTFADWSPRTGGEVLEVKPTGRSIRVLVDGHRTPVWFPVNFWDREWVVRREERAPVTEPNAGTPEHPDPVRVKGSPAGARAPRPVLLVCYTCGAYQALELRGDRAPGPFVMPRCCDAWMQAPPVARYQPVPLRRPEQR